MFIEQSWVVVAADPTVIPAAALVTLKEPVETDVVICPSVVYWSDAVALPTPVCLNPAIG
jgi:3D (Asp-Asp-Asp) domain-containing protein